MTSNTVSVAFVKSIMKRQGWVDLVPAYPRHRALRDIDCRLAGARAGTQSLPSTHTNSGHLTHVIHVI